jgi:beta-glucosidase
MYDYEVSHLEVLRKSLAECTVLLKKNGSFPVGTPGNIALYGNGVRKTVKGGTGSGEVNSRFFINIEEGFEKAGFTVTTKEWLDAYDRVRAEAKKQFIKDLKVRARKAHVNPVFFGMGAVMPEPEFDLTIKRECDTAIYVVARISGEGNDRTLSKGDIYLSDSEIRDILKLRELYDKFMLVLNTGGPVDLSPVYDKLDNILVLSQLGVETGACLADIVLGNANPSGKLTTTWAKESDYSKLGDFGDPRETYYKEGIYVGYKYFDSCLVKPTFPFGFGLSYTEFEVKNPDFLVEDTCVTVTATIKNTGIYPGKEALLVYISCPNGKLDKPVKQLAAFNKSTELAPGAEATVSASFKLEDFASYDEETASYILESGDYILRAGHQSTDLKPFGRITLPQTVTISCNKNVFGDPGFKDFTPPAKHVPELNTDIKTVTLLPENFSHKTYIYEFCTKLNDSLKDFSDEDLAYFAIGHFKDKAGLGSLIGNQAMTVAGAAGETVGRFRNRGIDTIVMADGPAGLRLSPQYYEDAEGAHTYGLNVIEGMLDLLPFFVKYIIPKGKPKNGEPIRDQYCTAIPIGTAIAQSFNPSFAKECGDIVGDEMERFNIDLWLAPALNIHRDIRCGRNFEYFSEDPIVSGVFAAAITKGVQAHAGKGVTIKHFAANNQETDRYNNNAHVSERAMREIYLKGFEICVREANPLSIMTSYNLINGTHTSEHRGLTHDILRCEWGYDNLVMTDWVLGGAMLYSDETRPIPNAGKVTAAGGDVFMPGCLDDYKRLMNELRTGNLKRKQLERAASHVLKLLALKKKA